MTRAAKLFLLLVVLSVPTLALAQQQKHSSPFIDQMVGYYTRIATAFNCPSLANTSYDSQLALLEFLPPTQNFNGWTRMFTANIMPLPAADADVPARMVEFRKNLLESIGHQGKIVDTRDMTTTKGLPVTYIEYIAGEGTLREHAAGVFARHSTQLAAFTQLQVRGANLSEADKANMQQLAVNMAKR